MKGSGLIYGAAALDRATVNITATLEAGAFSALSPASSPLEKIAAAHEAGTTGKVLVELPPLKPMAPVVPVDARVEIALRAGRRPAISVLLAPPVTPASHRTVSPPRGRPFSPTQ